MSNIRGLYDGSNNGHTNDNIVDTSEFWNKHSAPGQISRPNVDKTKSETKTANVVSVAGVDEVKPETRVRSGRRSTTSFTSIGSSRPRSGDVNPGEVMPDI